MKTTTKAAMFVIGIATLIGVIISSQRKKKQEEQPIDSEQESQPKDENVIMFSISEREVKVEKMPYRKEIRPREIGRLKSISDYARLHSFNSKKNSEVFKNSNLSIDDLRNIWKRAVQESLNSEEIYSFVQEEYIQKAEQTAEAIMRE